MWTDDSSLSPTSTDLSPTEAKFPSFWTVPFTAVRLGMVDGGVQRFIVVTAAKTSLREAFSGAKFVTSAGRATWFNLLSSPSLQANCNEEGFNLDYTAAGTLPHVRLGIVGNNEDDCLTPDSYLGFGAAFQSLTVCAGSANPNVTVGNFVPPACGAASDAALKVFGYIFVR